MGTIADLLGGALPEGWQESLADEQPVASTEHAAPLPEAAEPPTEEPQSADAAVLAAILDETGYDAERMRPDLRLDEDLELTGLALWSVVSQIEHELGITFPDRVVEGWRTLSDVLRDTADVS